MTHLSDFSFCKYLFAKFKAPKPALGKMRSETSLGIMLDVAAGDERRAIRNMLNRHLHFRKVL
jgi:hypothetical protein